MYRRIVYLSWCNYNYKYINWGVKILRVLIDIGHPAHVHFFKNTIWNLEKKGHQTMVVSRDKDVVIELLDAYGIPHTVLSKVKPGKSHLLEELFIREFKTFKIAQQFNPDILMGILSPVVAQIAWIQRRKSIIFNDTEHAVLAQKLTYPFCDIICTPSCYLKNEGRKQIRYMGYHELAYLHPSYFTPNPQVLKDLGVEEGEPFTILRFISWGAHHDVGHHGIKNKVALVQEVEKFGKVFITSEGPLDPEFERYRIRVPPEKIHHLLYYATLYVGEGATMAVESAILGTPSIYISTLAGTMGNFSELEKKYGLLFNYSDSESALRKTIEILKDSELKKTWRLKRAALLRDKINVTDFMVKLIENLPEKKSGFSLSSVSDESYA
jgi:predicted glycosyltransferase